MLNQQRKSTLIQSLFKDVCLGQVLEDMSGPSPPDLDFGLINSLLLRQFLY